MNRERERERERLPRRSNEHVSIKPRRSFNYPRHRNEEALIYRRVDEMRAMIRCVRLMNRRG